MDKKLADIIQALPWNKKIEVLQVIKGWTQEEAAKHYGSDPRTVGLWISGKSFPRKMSRKAISRAHNNIPLTEIFPAEILAPDEFKESA